MNTVRLALAGLVALSGCVTEITFDPFGGTAAVRGSWTVNGTPASEESCSAAGIATVELRIIEQFGSDSYSDSTLQAACASGGFTSAAVLDADTYRFEWAALDADGVEIGTSELQMATVRAGDIVELDPVDFVTTPGTGGFDPRGSDTTISGTWTINGLAADGATCADVGLATVRLAILSDPAGTEVFNFDFDCAAGAFDARDTGTPTLRAEMFYNRWEALDADGNVLASTDVLEIDTSVVTHAMLAVPDFELDLLGFSPEGDAVTLDGAWTINGLVPDMTRCMSAGIANVVLRFSPDAAQTETFDYVFDCATGGFDSRGGGEPLIRAQMFFTQWLAEDASETPFLMSDVLELDTSVVSHATLAAVDFEVATNLDIELAYETLAAGTGTCAEAGVSTISYTLFRAGSCANGDMCINDFGVGEPAMFGCGGATCTGAVEVVPFTGNVACTEQILITDAEPGEYVLDLAADGAGGTKWGGLHSGLLVEAGTEAYSCFFDIVP